MRTYALKWMRAFAYHWLFSYLSTSIQRVQHLRAGVPVRVLTILSVERCFLTQSSPVYFFLSNILEDNSGRG